MPSVVDFDRNVYFCPDHAGQFIQPCVLDHPDPIGRRPARRRVQLDQPKLAAFCPDLVDAVRDGGSFCLAGVLAVNCGKQALDCYFKLLRRVGDAVHHLGQAELAPGDIFEVLLWLTSAWRSKKMPLWQLALGLSFGVVVGVHLFGGYGWNFLNPVAVA